GAPPDPGVGPGSRMKPVFIRVYPWLADLLIVTAAGLVPGSRRREFVAQWRAELWHYAQWLEQQREPRARLRLIARASGAVPHAAQIRVLHWSPRMLAHD